jgi:hypothetical protein
MQCERSCTFDWFTGLEIRSTCTTEDTKCPQTVHHFKNVRYDEGQYTTRTFLVSTEVARNYTYVDYTQ